MHENLLYLKAALEKHPELKFVINQEDWQTDFLRFYQSQTNYNISKDNCNIGCSLYKDKKQFSFGIDSPDPQKIDNALAEALNIIDSLPDDPDFVDVEDDQRLAPQRQLSNNIEAISLERKTDILSSLAKSAAEHDFELYGTFICNYYKSRLINSNGLDKSSKSSPIYLEVKAVHNKSQITVLETFGGEDFKYFEIESFRAALMAKILNASNPVVDVEPGEYEVILAPRCLAEFAQYLCYGMSASALDQHSSFFEDKLNTRCFRNLSRSQTIPRIPA
jgi:predicted Zn-dependent protease